MQAFLAQSHSHNLTTNLQHPIPREALHFYTYVGDRWCHYISNHTVLPWTHVSLARGSSTSTDIGILPPTQCSQSWICGSSVLHIIFSKNSTQVTYPSMPYYHIAGRVKRSHSKNFRPLIWVLASVPASLISMVRLWRDGQKSKALVPRLGRMVINGYGLIHAASISREVLSFQKRSIPCSTEWYCKRSKICHKWKNVGQLLF